MAEKRQVSKVGLVAAVSLHNYTFHHDVKIKVYIYLFNSIMNPEKEVCVVKKLLL